MERFAMPRSRWGLVFSALFAPRGGTCTLSLDTLTVSVGLLGRAVVPVERIARLSHMDWPGVGGLGVRIGRGMVAFVLQSGPSVLIELDQEIPVRAPLRWRTARIVVRVEQPDHLIAALAARREPQT